MDNDDPLFEYDGSGSDSDISLTSTISSDHDEVYLLDRILAEEVEDTDDGPRVCYLVKWTGYPVHQSTWQTADDFTSNNPLDEWEERKRLEATGKEKPCDLDAFQNLVDVEDRKKQRRKDKRRAARLEREETQQVSGPSKKSRKLISRKHLAQSDPSRRISSVSLARKVPVSDESPPSSSPPIASQASFNSLFDSTQDGAAAKISTSSEAITSDPVLSRPNAKALSTSSTRSDALAKHMRTVHEPEPSKQPAPDGVKQSVSSANASKPKSYGANSTGTEAGPTPLAATGQSTDTAKRTGSSIFGKWDENKKRNVRKKLQGDPTKGDVRFRRLAHQNQIQKWANSEPAPNPNVLCTFNNETGRFEDALQTRLDTNKTASTSGLRVDTTVPPEAPPPEAPPPHISSASLSVSRQDRGKDITCPHWWKGDCKYSASECAFSHVNTGRFMPKKRILCKWWPNCKFTSEQCSHLHGDTTARDSYFERQYGQRSESPDDSGLRQDEVDNRRQKRRLNSLTKAQPSTATTPPAPLRDQEDNSAITDPQSSSKNVVASLDTMDVDTTVSDLSTKLHIIPPDGDAAPGLQLRLVFDFCSRYGELSGIVSQDAGLLARRMCLAKDFEHFSFDDSRTWASGDISPEGNTDTFEQLTEYLILNVAGAIVDNRHFLMVVYPGSPHVNNWDFLTRRSKSKSSSPLRFYIQLATQDGYEVSADAPRQDPDLLSAVLKKELCLDRGRLFQGNASKRLDKNAFVMFPSRNMLEVKIITAWLLELGATVYYFDVPGAWGLFKSELLERSRTGVVLLHPSMTQYYQMPGLHTILLTTSTNFFQLGHDATLRYDPERYDPDGATQYSCVRLFPTGGATLVTDDVFEFTPKLALGVLDTFYKAGENKPRGGKNDRIVTRPGIKAWLLDLADKYASDANIGHRLKLYESACRLLPDESEDDRVRLPNEEPPLLVSPSVADMPGYSTLWDQDESEATDTLVAWFAAWCIHEREQFRRFMVVHEQSRRPENTPGLGAEKDPREWSRKYNHIRVVNSQRWIQSRGKK